MYLKILDSTQYLKLIYFDINFDVIYIVVFFFQVWPMGADR